jgi:hypothetical protein
MEEVMLELLEPLALVVYGLLAALLTVAGLALEWIGLASGGSTGLGVPTLWFVYMGVVAIGAGALLARDKLVPGLRTAIDENRFRNP